MVFSFSTEKKIEGQGRQYYYHAMTLRNIYYCSLQRKQLIVVVSESGTAVNLY